MKTKYVCRGLISLYVNFHNNRTMSSTNLHVKNCSCGGKGTRAEFYLSITQVRVLKVISDSFGPHQKYHKVIPPQQKNQLYDDTFLKKCKF